MEVRGIGQGGQTSVPLNSQTKNSDGQSIKTNTANDNIVVNITSNGVEHRAIRENDLKKAVDSVNKNLVKDDSHIEYEIYGKFRDITIKIVDNNTKRVIREMPPKNIIDMITKFCEMAGLFLDQKA